MGFITGDYGILSLFRSEAQCLHSGLEYFDNVLHFGRPGIGIGCLYMGLEAIFFSLLIILAEATLVYMHWSLLSVMLFLCCTVFSLTRLLHILEMIKLFISP